ncbi:DUF4179 domain-containing protein [Clostridium intestinale]|uniref:DUF4179 domain-containing protein n=1 Tax=Clostridium intestinale TaxID=36845 RepID=A0A7D6VPP6_9CLOT|nr:DUF4179 domain-containing protein [Clostridium intestinale]QLY77897.1 DUF4179 domain-containing protein [Clostridium intestinale]
MEKDNFLDLIEISKNEDIDEGFHKIFDKTLNNLPKKKKHTKLFNIAASMALVAILSSYTMAFADSLPIISNIKDYFYAPEEYVKYSKNVDTSISYKSYIVDIKDVIFDNNFIIYSYSITRKDGKPFEEMEEEKLELSVLIDKEYLPKDSGYSGSCFNRVKNDNEVSYISYYIVKPLNLPDKIGVTFSLSDEGKIKKSVKYQLDKGELASQNIDVKFDKEFHTTEGSIYYDSISFTPFGAVFFSQNRGGWDFKDRDPYYFALFDETGRQLTLPTTSKGFDYDNKVTNIIKELTSSEYKGHKSITIKTYDSRTGEVLENSEVTVTIPTTK